MKRLWNKELLKTELQISTLIFVSWLHIYRFPQGRGSCTFRVDWITVGQPPAWLIEDAIN